MQFSEQNSEKYFFKLSHIYKEVLKTSWPNQLPQILPNESEGLIRIFQ